MSGVWSCPFVQKMTICGGRRLFVPGAKHARETLTWTLRLLILHLNGPMSQSHNSHRCRPPVHFGICRVSTTTIPLTTTPPELTVSNSSSGRCHLSAYQSYRHCNSEKVTKVGCSLCIHIFKSCLRPTCNPPRRTVICKSEQYCESTVNPPRARNRQSHCSKLIHYT